ncbi:hypothetical protein D1007_03467 [Hordeum vulgare]|nr:hypothetical protein D1007_03467 [Hordeum vulgare]
MAGNTGSQRKNGKETTEELLVCLNLQKEEEDDFVWKEELPDMVELTKCLAVARVHMSKNFSPNALYGDMRAAWNHAKPEVWRKVKENLFTTQFGCKGDWNKAMSERSWLFRDQVVILKGYNGFKNPESIKLDRLVAWVQIHRFSDKLLIERTLKGLASQIGEVEEVQLKLPAGFLDEFVRFKIKLDINSKIKHFLASKKGDKRVEYQVKYEKFPTFC